MSEQPGMTRLGTLHSVGLIALLLIAGCASSDAPPAALPPGEGDAAARENPQAQPGETPKAEMPQETTPTPGQKEGGISAQDEQWRKVAEEAAKRYSLQDQQDRKS